MQIPLTVDCPRRGFSRRLALLTGALLALLALAANGAQGRVVIVGSTGVGLQPREEASYWQGAVKWKGQNTLEGEANPSIASFTNDPAAPTQPGPVLHSLASYVIYWDPQDYYHGDWQGLIDGFLANVGDAGGRLDNVFAVDSQYSDRTNEPAASRSSFRGAYIDTNPYPTSECADPDAWTEGIPLVQGETVCLADAQLRAQLEAFVGEEHDLPTGMGTVFYLLTPPGVTVCLDGGGTSGHCSDFDGTSEEISEYEEGRATLHEREVRYEEELKAYEKALEEFKGEPGEPEPIAPTPPVPPTRPASYADYQRSFCSYHSAINPDGAAEGDAKVILYAVVPWTAGGAGDYNFAEKDRGQGDACQDGGFRPTSEPLGELEEKERDKPPTSQEEEEFNSLPPRQKREAEEARKLSLGRVHEQEPNQLASQRGPDGFWDEGLADLIIGQIAVEQQNVVTDPLLNGWHDSAGNEVTDECRNSFFVSTGDAEASLLTRAGTLSNQSFGSRSYYLNDAYNLAAERLPYPGAPCMDNVSLVPKFTAPNQVNAGETVAFDGMESDITLDGAVGYGPHEEPIANYATFKWEFGDGSEPVSGYAPGSSSAGTPAGSPCTQPWLSPCAATVFHSYQYGGTYEVTLTVTDVGGNTESVTKAISVAGPARPSGGTPGGGGGSGSGAPAGGSGAPAGAPVSGTTVGSGGSRVPVPGASVAVGPPTIGQSVLSTSLKKSLSFGLAVHYSVNEQVAGRVEVLLLSTTAKRLGVKGAPAAGLPKGYPRSIVIGGAVLVTTKGGSGTIRVKFAKAVAKRLAKAHRVELTLRFTLHNASRTSPKTTRTLSNVVLSR